MNGGRIEEREYEGGEVYAAVSPLSAAAAASFHFMAFSSILKPMAFFSSSGKV